MGKSDVNRPSQIRAQKTTKGQISTAQLRVACIVSRAGVATVVACECTLSDISLQFISSQNV